MQIRLSKACAEPRVGRLLLYDAAYLINSIGLLQGEDTGRYNIGVFVARHNQIETKLTELKNIIVKYYPSRANNNLLNTVLFDIYSCEKDLCSHCRVEDYMFVPLIAELEKKVQENAGR